VPMIRSEGAFRTRVASPRVGLWEIMDKLPTPCNLLIVRDERNEPRTLVTNGADPAHARTWLVHDLGSENVRLHKQVPDRTGYRIDVKAKTLVQLPSDPDDTARSGPISRTCP
jgi:hypothetical protein